jgi:hypothetical protein
MTNLHELVKLLKVALEEDLWLPRNESRMQGGCKNYKIIGSSLINNCRNLQDLLSAVLANMWWSLSVISRNWLYCQSGGEYALIMMRKRKVYNIMWQLLNVHHIHVNLNTWLVIRNNSVSHCLVVLTKNNARARIRYNTSWQRLGIPRFHSL